MSALFFPHVANEPPPTPQGEADKARQLFEIAASHPLQQRPQMAWSELLAAVATAYAERMARERFFSHVDPQGRGPNWRIRQAGYRLPGHYGSEDSANNCESITAVYDTAQGAWNRWLSTGHRVHVLAEDDFFREQSQIGCGFYELAGSEWTRYWVYLSCPPAA